MTLQVKQEAHCQQYCSILNDAFQNGAGPGNVEIPLERCREEDCVRFFREVFSDWKPSEADMKSCLSKALRPKPGPVIPQGFN